MATGSDTAYMSPTHLYVAMSPWLRMLAGRFGPAIMPTDRAQSTRIYGLRPVGDGSARYVGMGSLDGTVAGSWSMDEHDGVLRVAASSARPAGPRSSIVLLRPASGRLLDVGHLDGLAVGQQLKSVRWFDDLAVLVTFRQVDPFYVVDVADATHPRVLGALHLPGWSSYLHPVGPHLVLGLGQTSAEQARSVPAASWSTRRSGHAGRSPTPASPVDPQPMSRCSARRRRCSTSPTQHIRATSARSTTRTAAWLMAGAEPHQVTWLPDRDTLLTVIGGAYGQARAWISVLTIRDGTMHDRLVAVPAAADVNDVRTLPLADGRVVLVAGDSVQFLPL